MLQTTLRAKLSLILDRLETNEVLDHLLAEGVVRRSHMFDEDDWIIPPVEATDVSEEREILWWPEESRLLI